MNINIGKGGSGKITSTKGGSGKLIEKKYIDLLPNFISKVTLSGGTYSNGIYSRNSGGTTTFNGPDGKYIELSGAVWYAYDPAYGEEDSTYATLDFINWEEETESGVPTGVTQNSLSFLFDPIFYTNIGLEGSNIFLNNNPNHNPNAPDLGFLENNKRSILQYKNVIPPKYQIISHQYIPGKSKNTVKATFKNNTFSYIKSPDDSDLKSSNNIANIAYPKNFSDLKRPLLKMRKSDNSVIFNSSEKTLLFFVRLQRPVAHKAGDIPHRSKKGFFFHLCHGNVYDAGVPMLNIGYRSPHYLIDNQQTYRFKFEPFSFVFNLGHRLQENPTYMTDFKYKFGEMYCLAISVSSNSNFIKFYINGELQTMARLAYNPIIVPSSGTRSGKGSRRLYSSRKSAAPMAPNFQKINGDTYGATGDNWGYEDFAGERNCIIFGKTNMGHYWRPGSKRSKKYLNNLDIGVTMAYNAALSQEEINQIYETYRYRYV